MWTTADLASEYVIQARLEGPADKRNMEAGSIDDLLKTAKNGS